MAYTPPTVQGRFTSTGVAQMISIPSSFDWIRAINLTQIAAAGAGGLKFYWQRGMPNGQGIVTGNSGALTLTQLAAGTGFTLLDTSDPTQQLGASFTITNTTNTGSPVISTGTTTGVVPGSVVRLFNMSTGHAVDGVDFTVSAVTAGVSFTLAGVFGTAPFTNGAATGSYRLVNYNSGPWAPWYPPYRNIIGITTGTTTVISLNVASNYQVGQEVVFSIPLGYGMTQLDGMTGTITAVTNPVTAAWVSTISVNIDSTGFSAFTYLNSFSLKNRAVVAPVGSNTGYILQQNPVGNILNDAVRNNEIVGALLAAGANSPAGVANDVIYWISGSSARVDNL